MKYMLSDVCVWFDIMAHMSVPCHEGPPATKGHFPLNQRWPAVAGTTVLPTTWKKIPSGWVTPEIILLNDLKTPQKWRLAFPGPLIHIEQHYRMIVCFWVHIIIPAYHSGFSGIITEKHIKLRYYGEGEIIPECFWLRKVNWIAAITGNNSCEVGKLATRDHWLRPVPPPTA